MAANDGGPAFPSGDQNWKGEPGMMLRDWLAGQALVGMLSRHQHGLADPDTNQAPRNAREGMTFAARQAYGFADAMLKAREAS